MDSDEICTDAKSKEPAVSNSPIVTESLSLIPVPRGMCPSFYKFMGAGCPRREDGQIMMLGIPRKIMDESIETNYSSAKIAAEQFSRSW